MDHHLAIKAHKTSNKKIICGFLDEKFEIRVDFFAFRLYYEVGKMYMMSSKTNL